jgi:hypothetical protein
MSFLIKCCSNCNSSDTYIDKKTGVHYWRKGLCQKCHDKLIHNPKWNVIINKKKIRYKDKQILLSSDPRKHFCVRCGLFGKTHLHHLKYHDDDPLKDTIELCPSCHGKNHGKKTQDLSRRFIIYWRNRWMWLLNK